MPCAGFKPITSASKRSRPTPQTARTLGPSKLRDRTRKIAYSVETPSSLTTDGLFRSTDTNRVLTLLKLYLRLQFQIRVVVIEMQLHHKPYQLAVHDYHVMPHRRH
jgi:hypothetical protein